MTRAIILSDLLGVRQEVERNPDQHDIPQEVDELLRAVPGARTAVLYALPKAVLVERVARKVLRRAEHQVYASGTEELHALEGHDEIHELPFIGRSGYNEHQQDQSEEHGTQTKDRQARQDVKEDINRVFQLAKEGLVVW